MPSKTYYSSASHEEKAKQMRAHLKALLNLADDLRKDGFDISRNGHPVLRQPGDFVIRRMETTVVNL